MEGKVLLGQYLIWVMLLLAQIHGCRSCIQKEKEALLELKKYLISKTPEWEPDPVLPTWTNDTNSNCCQWNGLKCNRTSRRVMGLSIDNLILEENSLLNLSLLHPFEEVRSLYLNSMQISGLFDDVEGYKSLRRLRNLEIMDLSNNRFNNSIFPFLNAATSLTTLFLRSNNWDGPLHVKELKDLKNLELLDLSCNSFNGSIPVREFTALMSKLKVLDLSGNGFSGSIKWQEYTALSKLKALDLSNNEFSDSIELLGVCKLKNIEELGLRNTRLVGQFPSCITSLTRLRVLDLSSNNLTGRLPDALGNLESLEYLSLFDNNFEGIFSLGSLANLSKLKVLKLGATSNSLKQESESSWKPKFQLSVISLKACNLGKVPHFLLYQKDLRDVNLSDNQISGKFPHWLLENNTKLEALVLRNNSFSSFQLPESDHNLLILDVSVNEFDQLFPDNIGWIFPHLQHMNLANNRFHGNMPSSLGNMKSIYVLSMDNNQFTGKIGQGLRSLRSLSLLDISNNNLTGGIPSWIGDLPQLNALVLSNNSLEGEIPVSLFNTSDLILLDLSANKLSGVIPSLHVSSSYQRLLLLQGNNLSGAIPNTLLVNVSTLNLRNNRLFGNIPEFINTQDIGILLLGGNNLTGRIPQQLCGLRKIHLLDLSNNRLNGSIPSCLSNTSFGFGQDDTFDNSYDSSFVFSAESSNLYFKSLIMQDNDLKGYDILTQTKIEFATKHRYDAYKGTNLNLLFGLDLSENELTGEIPVELGGLLEVELVKSLNLSHNNLSGSIPESFSGLKNVESLDLSFNRLHGRIPSQLSDISSLAVFNVSYNNLSGIIPEGRQFNTFEAQSYLGNPLLCGKPTNLSCESNYFQETDNGAEADESTIDMVSFYWSLAAAYVTILLGIFASLSFDSPWSRFWFYIVDDFIHKVRNLIW